MLDSNLSYKNIKFSGKGKYKDKHINQYYCDTGS